MHQCYITQVVFSSKRKTYLFNSLFSLSLYHYCSRETYNALTNWLTDARTLASPNIVIVLVGNKKDLEADREVTFMEASRFAQENGEGRTLQLMCDKPVLVITEFVRNSFVCVCAAELSFLETSALTGENVEEVFLKCTRSILSKIDAGQYVAVI